MEQESLTLRENEITRTTLGFLKAHYRQRNRIGNTELSSDMRGAGGIIADGFLRYPVKGGKYFIATVEATSVESKDEVTYKVQKELILWDSAAIATIITAVIFAFLYLRAFIDIRALTYAGTVAALITVAGLVFWVLINVLKNRRRYRYIYAIEQFKQYYADEQWIAISENVFPVPEKESSPFKDKPTEGDESRDEEENKFISPEYQELIHQCIHNGVGLIVVPRDSTPRIKITPSREDIFKNKRKRIRLVSKEEISRLSRLGNFPDWLRGIQADNLLRYQQKYKYQWGVCLIALLITGAVFYKDLQIIEEKEVDYEQYVQEMEKLMKQNRNIIEPQYYYLDTPYVWPQPIRKDIESYAMNLGLRVADNNELPPNIKSYQNEQSSHDFIVSAKDMKDLIAYDCARLYNLQATSYIVQVDAYPTYEEAIQRISELRALDFESNGLRMECFDEIESGYAIYFGLVYKDIHSARRALQTYQILIGDNPLKLDLSLRSLSPRQ